ncbi:MAG: AAA family ATPase [Patescibacteria group bacterium]
MRYTKFKIKNFKGIKEVEVDLSNNRIITLVGLNESGKTTILEAINLFHRMVKSVLPKESELNTYRPKGIDFTGNIEISGDLIFEEADYQKLNNYLKNNNKKTKIEFPKIFSYTYKFSFKTHKYQDTTRSAGLEIKSGKNNGLLHKNNNTLWNELLKHIKSNLVPEILFYEDFIFVIPDNIQFTKNPTPVQAPVDGSVPPPIIFTEEEKKNNEWQLVLDDILKTVNPEFISFQEFVANQWDSDNDTARQRISAMEKLLDKKITVAWKELFKEEKSTGKKNERLNFKEIKLICTPNYDKLDVSFKIKTDSGKEFSINERSKGCKWFFSFLIFTEFRKNRTANILFLLDEPASNLHSSAQTKILDAIGQLSDKSMVIYSTHSHHMINPLWLSGAYVVINESISDANLEGSMTDDDGANISAEKYYKYVATQTGKTQYLYYQPILDSLDYAPSAIEPIPDIIITEGKYDWYTFKYFNEVILKGNEGFNFYPGAGRDTHSDIIRLYLSWGKSFLLVLDGDKPGQTSQANYVKDFTGYVENRIFTYKDLLGLEVETEELIIPNDQKVICDTAFGVGSYDSVKSEPNKLKSKLNFAISQLLIIKKQVPTNPTTKANFRKLFKELNAKLKKLQ